MAIFNNSGSQASQDNSSVSPRKVPFKKGDFIGQKYEVFDVLGEGGFGIVYLVYSHETKDFFALKTFKDEFLEDIKIRERFRKEAQVWIDLERYPYLVRAYFVDEISGRLYIAMEYIAFDEPGMNTLEGYLRRRPPDLAQSLKWAIQFCHGMEYAYSKGIKAHRDIKPSNIMIDQNKTVKITDFGLAGIFQTDTISEQGVSVGKAGSDSSMRTVMGTSIGTPEYMSPEQFTDFSACDESSDIYSFGIVLYQMASGGKLPFNTDNPTYRWTALKYFHQEAHIPELKSPLFTVIQRCLEKEPRKRYQSFREFRLDIEVILKRQTGEIVKMPKNEEMASWEWNIKGVSLDRIGKTIEALECFENALKIDGQYANAWGNKGIAFTKLNELSKAIYCFDRVLEIDKDHLMSLSNKAIALEYSGRFSEAIDYYLKAIRLSPHHHIAWINLSACQFSSGNYHEALISADKALEICPDYASAWNNKGLILYNIDRDQEAFLCFNKAIQLDPFSIAAWENIGMMMCDKGLFDKAAAVYDHILATKPDYEKAWIKKGDCLVALHNFSDAAKCYGHVANTNKNSLDAWIGGSVVFPFLNEEQRAIDCSGMALMLDPNNVYSWNRQGKLYLISGYFEKALECFDKAIYKEPTFAKAWLGKHDALKNLGRNYEAKDAFNKYDELRLRK